MVTKHCYLGVRIKRSETNETAFTDRRHASQAPKKTTLKWHGFDQTLDIFGWIFSPLFGETFHQVFFLEMEP